MRGQLKRSGSLFSYVSIEELIPASHPLRRIHLTTFTKIRERLLNEQVSTKRIGPEALGQVPGEADRGFRGQAVAQR
jgi:hypothetical protein